MTVPWSRWPFLSLRLWRFLGETFPLSFLLAVLPPISDSALAAEIKGVYPVKEHTSPKNSKISYVTPEYGDVTEYKIYSDFETIVWNVTEIGFEDGSSVSIHGPRGILFGTDNGEVWGYSNHNGLIIFLFDYENLVALIASNSIGQFSYGYDAFLIRNGKISSYACVFDLSRFSDFKSIARDYLKNAANGVTLDRIGKFLAKNGVDPKLDQCREAPELLNKSVVEQAERDMQKLPEAERQP